MSAEQIDLLPCPFCGSSSIDAGGSQVTCNGCGAATEDKGDWLENVSFWNSRSTPVNTALAEDAARAHDLALENARLRARITELHEAGWMHAEAFCIIEDSYQDEARRTFEKTLTSEPLGDTHAATAALVSARDSIPEGE